MLERMWEWCDRWPSGDAVSLKEYLEQVWAAVAKEALSMVFEGADASGFEPDARLTAIWLWTLNAGKADAANGDSDEEEETGDESEGSTKKPKTAGFILEYDAARKIAQGLGAHLENLASLAEVSGEQARLLPVAERARYLFGKDEGKTVAPQRKKREAQMDLFRVLEDAESIAPTFGDTTLGWKIGTRTGGSTTRSSVVRSSLSRGQPPDLGDTGPGVAELSLTRRIPARVRIDFKVLLVRWYFYSGGFINPFTDLRKRAPQKLFVNVPRVCESEVQIFRETIRFEIALLQARAAFEDPAFLQILVRINPGQDPAQDKILSTTCGLRPNLVAASMISLRSTILRLVSIDPRGWNPQPPRRNQALAVRARIELRHTLAHLFFAGDGEVACAIQLGKEAHAFKDGAIAQPACIFHQLGIVAVGALEVDAEAIGDMLDSGAKIRIIEHVDHRSMNVRNVHLRLTAPRWFASENLLGLHVLQRELRAVANLALGADSLTSDHDDIAEYLFREIPMLGGCSAADIGW